MLLLRRHHLLRLHGQLHLLHLLLLDEVVLLLLQEQELMGSQQRGGRGRDHTKRSGG